MTEHLGAFPPRESALAERLAASASADREFQTILQQAVAATVESRRRLDALEAEIRESAGAWAGLDTPAGNREFQQYLATKTREIHRIVADAADDSRRRANAVSALADRYPAGDEAG